MKICQICNTDISVESKAKKYCSEECRRRVKYEKDRAWLKANPTKAAGYSRKWREANPVAAKEAALYSYRKKCMLKLKGDT